MKASTVWPWAVGAVLFVTVTVNCVLFYVAGDDPSFVIEPNYYAKAIGWDSTMAQARRNDALAWRLTPTLAPFTKQDGARLTVTLTDSTGREIADAVVKVSAFYNARAGTILNATLAPNDSGYSGRLAVTHGGQWELEFDVTRGAERFTVTSRIDAVASGRGP